MATFQKFEPFIAAVHNGIHNLSTNSLKVALTNSVPLSTNGILADITEIAYTNLSSRVLTVTSSTQVAGLYKLIIADLLLTAGGGPVATFRYIVIYNDTAASKNLICWVDYGAGVTLTDGSTLNIDMNAVSGVLQNT